MSLLLLFFLSEIDFESSSVHQPFQNQLSFCHPLHLLSLVFHSIISFFPIYLKCYSYFPWLLWLVLTHSAFAFLLTFPSLKRVFIFLVVSIFHFYLGRDLASTDLWAAPGETTPTSPYPIYFHISQSYSLAPYREASHSWKIWLGISDCYSQFWLSCKTHDLTILWLSFSISAAVYYLCVQRTVLTLL